MHGTVIAYSIQKVLPCTQAVAVAMRPRGWSVMVAWLLPGDRPPEVQACPTDRICRGHHHLTTTFPPVSYTHLTLPTMAVV